jgi:L-ascorbate metabolism protein UlaG (beta-lactamase superfamily)
MDIRWIGHATFELVSGDDRILIDPFLAPDNPAAVAGPDDVDPTDILLTHGHSDHMAHVVDVAKRSGARCVAIVELANWLSDQGIDDVADPNLGGTVERPWGWVKLVPAFHTNTLPDGTVVGLSAGLVINVGGATVYHLGDTALYGDLKLTAERHDISVALVPIGGHYTMDQDDAVTAAELLDADVVIPMHYDTFPPIEADEQRFKSEVEASPRTSSDVVILEPGETYTV